MLKQSSFLLSLVVFGLLISGLVFLQACAKISGHDTGVVGKTSGGSTSGGSGGSTSGGSTGGGSTGSSNAGVGSVAIGGTNTIIFQTGGKTYSFSSPAYYFGINSLKVFMSTSTYSTDLSCFDIAFVASLNMSYENSVAGTYSMNHFNFTTTGINLQATGATTLITKVVTEGIHVTNTTTNQASGTVQGTFDGYVTDTKTTNQDSVKISGSFNLVQ
jgi:hypothetical protein